VAIEAGPLEDIWAEPPEDAFEITVNPKDASDEPEYIEIEFKEGTPVAINGKQYPELWKLIWDLNEIAGKHGVGRIDMVENMMRLKVLS